MENWDFPFYCPMCDSRACRGEKEMSEYDRMRAQADAIKAEDEARIARIERTAIVAWLRDGEWVEGTPSSKGLRLSIASWIEEGLHHTRLRTPPGHDNRSPEKTR